jgi:hypothetical protein
MTGFSETGAARIWSAVPKWSGKQKIQMPALGRYLWLGFFDALFENALLRSSVRKLGS